MKVANKVLIILIVLTGFTLGQIASDSWTTFKYIDDRTTALMSTWSDVNGDGDIDVAIASQYNNYPWIRVLKNDATTLWTYTGSSSGTAKWVDFGDMDDDGDNDLAVAASGSTWVFKDNGSTLSSTPDWSKALTNAHCVAWGNYNDDSRVDLAIAANGYVYIFNGIIGGTLNSTANWSWNFGSGTVISLSFGVLDDDQTEKQQSLAIGIAGTGVYVFENTGTTLPSSYSWSKTNPDGCVFADFDNDGDDDIYVNHYNYSNRIDARVYLSNNGSITTSYYNATFNTTDGTASGSNMLVADFNSDGYNDLAMKSGVNNSQYSAYTGTSIYYNDSGTGFDTDYFIIPHSDTPLPQDHYTWLGNVTAEDVDNDGDYELFVGSYEKDYDVSGEPPYPLNWERIYLSYFENEGDAAPAPPQNLAVSAQNNHPYLTWNENTEADLDYYEVWKKKGLASWAMCCTTSNNYYEDDVEDIITGKPKANQVLVQYKLIAVDVSDNESDYSNTVQCYVEGEDPEKGVVFNVRNIRTAELNSIPYTFYINQNYPNPFNPETNITFGIPEDNFVSLVVYNIQGEKVASLVNEHLSAGSHTAKFDGSLLPSGVYIYRIAIHSDKIQAGSFAQIKRMLLIK